MGQVSCLGIPDTTHRKLLYSHIPKMNIIYMGTPGASYK